MLKLNLGCGSNRLSGWKNCDAEVDISKPLPFADASADFILCEHCLEHIDQYQAIHFLKECRRVLNAKGVARIVVPSVEQILDRATPDYCQWGMSKGYQSVSPTPRGAAHAIIYSFGHKAIWTASLLRSLMIYCGFERVNDCLPGVSGHPQLCNVDGHHKVIGRFYNSIESVVMEGSA